MLHRRDLCYGQRWWGRSRRHQTRKRHENHGDCGSPWITTVGQHACGQPSRGPLGAAVLRLLHGRSQAGEFDRRSSDLKRATAHERIDEPVSSGVVIKPKDSWTEPSLGALHPGFLLCDMCWPVWGWSVSAPGKI